MYHNIINHIKLNKMPLITTHIEIAIIFALAFAIGMILPDFDHMIKCSPKNIINAALTDNKDTAFIKENNAVGGCRGFAHTLWFAILATALWLGYIIHYIMDVKGSVGGI